MIQLTDNLEINKPAPVDDRLGVFESTEEALAYIAEDRRYIGLTLIVDSGSGAVEYWFENGIQDGDLTAKSTGGTQVNADWNATSGVAEILNKPTIPSAQVNSDWNAVSGVAQILNKPTIPSITNLVPYTGANQDVDLGTNNLNAKSVKINGTAGNGHVGLKHQSSNATAQGQETALFAGSDGELYYKNDGLTVAQIASRAWVNLQGFITNVITSLGFTPEDVANKQTDLTASATKYPTVNAVNTGLATKEPTITAGTTAQYWRGDKSWQTLNSTAVGLGNVNNTSDANKPISTATQTALDRITTLFQDVSQLSTTSTTAVTLTTFTVASANIPVGGIIRIVGLAERTAGANNTTIGLNVNSAGARYFQSAGQTMQFEMLLCKMTSTTLRYGLGPSGSTTASYNVQNIASVSASQDGSGNFVISLLGFVGTAGATLTIQFVKGNLL